jgi:hypothetical protein
MCVRACVRPTGQFRVLMDRLNRPGRSDSENGNLGPDDWCDASFMKTKKRKSRGEFPLLLNKSNHDFLVDFFGGCHSQDHWELHKLKRKLSTWRSAAKPVCPFDDVPRQNRLIRPTRFHGRTGLKIWGPVRRVSGPRPTEGHGLFIYLLFIYFFFFFALNCSRCYSENFRIWFSGHGFRDLGSQLCGLDFHTRRFQDRNLKTFRTWFSGCGISILGPGFNTGAS